MEEENPLQVTRIVAECKSPNNKRGRPTLAKTIRFTAQPKSLIISQLLSKQTEKHNLNTSQKNLTILKDNSPEASPQFAVQTLQNGSDIINEEEHNGTNGHINERLHYCDYPKCTYTCKLSCNLIKHKRTHTSEKPYLCDQCTFRSNFVNSLKVHKRTHTSERPYGCKHCTYRCNSSSNLKKHCLHRHPEVPKT